MQNAQTQTADTQSEQTQVDGESYEKMVKRARTLAGAMQTLKVMPALQRGAIMAQDVVESMSVAAVAAEKAPISEDGQTHVTVDGQDVVAETVGIAWDQAGTPQLKVRINGQIESVAMDRVRFGSREAATRAMAASTIGGTEAANTLYNAKVQQGTRFLDYARDFMSAYRAAGMGIKKETLRYAGTLTALNELELDAAYEMGRRSTSAMAQAKGLNRTEAVRYFKAVLEAAGETNVNGLAAALADAVQRGTVSGAQADLISASPSAQVILQGREVRTDMDGTLTARAYGQSGRSYAELMDTLQGMGMTRGQADSEAVRTAYQQAREQDNARAQRKAARPDTRGGLRDITAQEAERAGVGVVNREGMSARQQAYTQALEALAGQLGVDMVLYESPVKDGVHVGRDGWYDRSTGTIYIDVEAGYNGEQAMMRVAAHELTHYIEQWNPKGYQSLRELLLDYYYQKDYDTVRSLVQEQLELAQQNGQRIGEAEAMDEVIANACEMMLSDAEAITAIAQKNQTLGKRIRAWIERTLSAMKEALKGLKPHSSAAKLLEKSRETLESARGMWLRALDEISQGEAQQARETGTQGSQREAQDIATNGIRMGQSDGERYQWLRDTEIEAASVSAGQITPQQIALVNGMGYTKAMTLLEKAAKSYGLIADGQQKAATLQNKHLSIAAEFSKRSLSESLRKQSHAADGNQRTGNGYIAALLPVFKQTYENAVPVLVQGEGAPPQLVKAVETFNERRAADVLIIGRGGGSIEELWAFNDERVARAVAASAIPVISAVGHETDFTICDFAADLRAPTPSAAAELAVPDTRNLLGRLAQLQAISRQAVAHRLQTEQKRLTALRERRCLSTPLFYVEGQSMRLDYATRAFANAAQMQMTKADRRLVSLSGKLDALSPLKVLSRGYAIPQHDGEVIKSVTTVAPGDALELRMSDGTLHCTVQGKDE